MANPYTSASAGVTSPLDFVAPEIAQSQRQLARQQQLADLLRAQALQPVDTGTQSVGGWAIANSPIKPFEKLGYALLARNSQKGIDEQQAALASQYQQRMGEALAGLKSGKPSVEQAAMISAMFPNLPPSVVETMAMGAKNKITTVDNGGSVSVLATPEYGPISTIAPVFESQRSVTPDAQLQAETARRGQDITQETALRGQDITQGTAMRGQDMTANTARRGQDMTADTAAADRAARYGPPAASRKADEARAVKEAQLGVDRTEEQRKVGIKFDAYQKAIEGLKSALGAISDAQRGAIQGRFFAMAPASQAADGAVAAMAPVLKDLFRTAGEGTFTDQDQKLLLDMVPTRADEPTARDWKLANIDRIVRAKLNMPAGDELPELGVYEKGKGLVQGAR